MTNTVRISLVQALDLVQMGLANGNVGAARQLLLDLRPQAVELEAKASADIARLDWLESRGHIALDKHDGVARIWDSPPCIGYSAASIREAIDVARDGVTL